MNTNNATLISPFEQLHWTSQDIADAVPLRLHELFAFDATRDAAPGDSANAADAAQRTRIIRGSYLPRARLSDFMRVR